MNSLARYLALRIPASGGLSSPKKHSAARSWRSHVELAKKVAEGGLEVRLEFQGKTYILALLGTHGG